MVARARGRARLVVIQSVGKKSSGSIFLISFGWGSTPHTSAAIEAAQGRCGRRRVLAVARQTCGLEIAKVKRMGFKVFAFKQRSEDGDSERLWYVYACSEKETVRCRREGHSHP
jgi:hypothetical protein